MLAALAAALGGDARRQVRVAHAAFGLVLMLAPRAAAAKGVALQVLRPHVDLDGALDLGHDIDGGERRLPAGVGIEGADAHEPVYAAFTLQMAISKIADHVQRGAANAGLVVAQLVDNFDLVAVPLGPAGVQAQEHLRPVARLGAAGAGLDAQVGVAGILGTAQHRLHLEVAEPFFHGPQLGLQFALEAGIFLGKLRQRLQIRGGGLKVLVGLEQAVQRLQLLDDLLGLFRVVPEARLAHLIIELCAQRLLGGNVKDCPGAESDG